MAIYERKAVVQGRGYLCQAEPNNDVANWAYADLPKAQSLTDCLPGPADATRRVQSDPPFAAAP